MTDNDHPNTELQALHSQIDALCDVLLEQSQRVASVQRKVDLLRRLPEDVADRIDPGLLETLLEAAGAEAAQEAAQRFPELLRQVERQAARRAKRRRTAD
jgi:hypothetical protein